MLVRVRNTLPPVPQPHLAYRPQPIPNRAQAGPSGLAGFLVILSQPAPHKEEAILQLMFVRRCPSFPSPSPAFWGAGRWGILWPGGCPSPSACLRPLALAVLVQICPDPVLKALIYNFYTLSRPWRFPPPQVLRGRGCF